MTAARTGPSPRSPAPSPPTAHRPEVILTPGALQEVRGEFKPFYDDALFAQIDRLLLSGHITRADPAYDTIRALAQRVEPQSANKFLSRDFLARTGLGFPNGHFFEDIYFHTGAIAMANSLTVLDAPTFCYFRRHFRSQITSTNGDLRMDSVAVTRLTLDSFAKSPAFADPVLRGAVLVSTLRMLIWCLSETSHPQRPALHLAAKAAFLLVDPGWLELPWLHDATLAPPELGDVGPAVTFLTALEVL